MGAEAQWPDDYIPCECDVITQSQIFELAAERRVTIVDGKRIGRFSSE